MVVHESAQACVGVNRNGLEAVCELACTLVKRGARGRTGKPVTDVEPTSVIKGGRFLAGPTRFGTMPPSFIPNKFWGSQFSLRFPEEFYRCLLRELGGAHPLDLLHALFGLYDVASS